VSQLIALPRYAIPVVVDGEVRLRVYAAPCLELDMALRPRQALVLAGQLLNLALHSVFDRCVLEAAGEQRVARHG
jgi:hypothetical protein